MSESSDTPGHVRLGFLYPGYAAEDDYPRMGVALEQVAPIVVHTRMREDAHRVAALLEIGSSENLLAGAATLREQGVAAAMWACTSGSFVFGWEGSRLQAREIEEFLGIPASSTSIAFVSAARKLGLSRVAVAATYPEDVSLRFEEYLGEAHISVVALGSEDIVTAAEVGVLDRERVLSFIVSRDHPEAQGVLVPDTALHTIEWLPELEARLGKPVLTANQVTMWEALRLAGEHRQSADLGTLFRTES
ncbi:MAG: maleate cis-trans isomerase [Dehalococcoidia bacterium]